MGKKTYLHTSYITSKGGGNFIFGDLLLDVPKNASINDIRGYIMEEMKKEFIEDAERLQTPSLLSITVLKKRLYKQLSGK